MSTSLSSGCRVTVRPQDEIALIKTRHLGCTTNDVRLANELQAARFDPASYSWAETTWQEVAFADSPGVSTIIYVHGNAIPACDARNRGLDVYRKLVRCSCDDRPMRFIIWSWPSAEVSPSRVRDYQIKAERTRPVGYQLAWFVEQMPAGMPIGFFGYSYGARVESGAAHLLAGGSLGGLRLASGGEAVRRPAEHVYLAPAYDSGWLSPRRFHGRAMQQIDRLMVSVNPRDPAMRFYPLLSKSIRERALGYDGPTGLPRRYASRVRLRRVGDSVGRSHDLYDYMAAPGLMRSAWRRLTFADRPPNPSSESLSPTTEPATTEPTPVAMATTAGH